MVKIGVSFASINIVCSSPLVFRVSTNRQLFGVESGVGYGASVKPTRKVTNRQVTQDLTDLLTVFRRHLLDRCIFERNHVARHLFAQHAPNDAGRVGVRTYASRTVSKGEHLRNKNRHAFATVSAITSESFRSNQEAVSSAPTYVSLSEDACAWRIADFRHKSAIRHTQFVAGQ